MRAVCGVWSLIALVGCAGQVKMSRLEPKRLENGEEVRGVIVYRPGLLKLTHSFTTLVDKDGKAIGTAAERTCR